MMRYWFSDQKVVLLGMNLKRLLFGTLLLSFNLFVFSQSQIGSDIDGEAADDRSGYSVSLSSDGSTMAIGAVLNDGNGTDAGHVRVYITNLRPFSLQKLRPFSCSSSSE